VVATGATQPPGGAHAEAVALAACDARGADLYVTLEPCAPFPGKRTPPCAEVIAASGVRRVAVALEDPHPGVRGHGLAILRAAGVKVEVGDGAEEATALLRPYLKHRQAKLPYVIAKWAASLDGRTATRAGDSKWITGAEARDYAHQQRARVDVVMAGSGTVLADNPALTARPGGALAARQPARVVLDARGRTPLNAQLFEEGGPLIFATASAAPGAWRSAVAARGAQLIDCEAGATGLNLHQLLRVLGERGLMSVWAEGGATLLGSLFDGGHVDEVWAFIAPVVIGGANAWPSVGGDGPLQMAEAARLRDPVVERLGEDLLIRGYTGEWEP
jgi:diaminohydroxyphosphoribosylaminopyrimidine deaminase / 5-amino-6-(5-phosphoribosylamino)uracil reductase